MTSALYPGTFDPITNGHVNIIERSSKIFQHVFVAVAENPKKEPLIPVPERTELIRTVLGNIPNVSVIWYKCLTTDCAKTVNCDVILRGVRDATDFDYEFKLATVNRYIDPNIETIMMTPDNQLSMVSSSVVKEMFSYECDISEFVHPLVEKALKQYTK